MVNLIVGPIHFCKKIYGLPIEGKDLYFQRVEFSLCGNRYEILLIYGNNFMPQPQISIISFIFENFWLILYDSLDLNIVNLFIFCR